MNVSKYEEEHYTFATEDGNTRRQTFIKFLALSFILQGNKILKIIRYIVKVIITVNKSMTFLCNLYITLKISRSYI